MFIRVPKGYRDEDERTGRQAETIDFKLNGETISALAGETIIQAAKRHGVDIPHLCYKEGYRPDGNCRACVVEIKGERVLAPSCCRSPAKDMEVSSVSRARGALAEDGARAPEGRRPGGGPQARR